jgi:fermentation-respiration switch protein FrsA (DUF1100 family)
MVQRMDVEFPVEGDVTLRGWLYVPDGAGPHPAISMAHGFAGVKEHGLDRFARLFADAGFVVLVHDHRGFGASDGSPRFDVDPGPRSTIGAGPSLFWRTIRRSIRTGSVCGAPVMPVDTRSCSAPQIGGCVRW